VPPLDIDALIAFAAIPAPTGAESARLDWLQARLAAAPGTRERDGAGNLIWRCGAAAALLVMAHVDTVFAAGTPLTVVRDGDWLVGPGIGDNAAAVIALVSVLEVMTTLPPGLAVAFTVGEEGLGNLRGARHACAALAPAAAIALEGHGLDEVVIEHVGSLRARVTVTGPGGHSWWDSGTPSAVHALAALIGPLAAGGANVGRISGGDAVNAIAGEAEMLIELRSLQEAELEAFAARLAGLADGLAAPLSLSVEIVGRRPAGRIGEDHPLVRAAMEVRRGLGLPAAFRSGSTDANAAAALGIPAIGLGCGRGSGMHTTGERISVRSLELGCRQIEAVLRALCGA
jgi:acetylornithine deacetylase/succinyl-diaminopimelate desuccinylase-like protein